LKVAATPWHVWQRGVNRSRCFSGAADRLHYLRLLAKFAVEHACQVHAYVLMTNHFHLLVTPEGDESVSRMMKAVNERYVRAFNKRHRRTGTLWEGRFKSTVVETDRYLFNLYRYIELNPVRAGMVTRPDEYEWSSHAANAFGTQSALVTPHRSFLEIAPDPEERRLRYRALFDARLSDEELAEIRDAICGGFALGGPVHHGLVESHTGMRSQRRRRRNGVAAAKSVPI
jgi:putative transposase